MGLCEARDQMRYLLSCPLKTKPFALAFLISFCRPYKIITMCNRLFPLIYKKALCLCVCTILNASHVLKNQGMILQQISVKNISKRTKISKR